MGSLGKWLLLASLYFSQGLPYGFFTQALPALMRQKGASLPLIGLTSFLVLPWALKFLWAPLVDRYGSLRHGRRKSWILVLQMLGMVVFLGLGARGESEGYGLLMIGFFLANLIAATQDIASDGLAVVLLNHDERGIGNGLQVAGYRTGMIAGGGLILMLFSLIGWQGAFYLIALMIALATVPVYFLKEPPPQESRDRGLLRSCLKRNGFLVWLLVIGFYKFGDAIATGMLRPFLVDQGLGMDELGRVVGTVGFVAGLLGALVGGLLVNWLGRFRALVWLGVAQALAVSLYGWLALGALSMNQLILFCTAEHFTGGMATAALFTLMMDVSRPEAASTDYSVQASCVVIATLLSSVASGYLANALGYTVLFFVSAVLSLGGAGLFAALYGPTNWRDGRLRL